MSINAITNPTGLLPTSIAQSNADKTVEQRAQDGDPIAKAQIKQQQQQEQPEASVPSEPGKGENVDQYI